MTPAESPTGRCTSEECKREVIRAYNRAAEQKRRADAERWAVLAEQARPAAATALNLAEPGRYPLAVIPRNEHPLIPLSPERRAAFTAHLTRVIAKAESPDEDVPPDVVPADSPGGLAAVLGQACGLCKGYCCGLGGNAAYLRVPTIRRYRAAHPEKTADEVLVDYLSRLAEESVENSCVFHQSSGCGLSRDMRSETCNRHFCQGLKEFLQAHGNDTEVRGFFVTVLGGVVGQAAFIDGAGTRRVPDGDPAV